MDRETEGGRVVVVVLVVGVCVCVCVGSITLCEAENEGA